MTEAITQIRLDITPNEELFGSTVAPFQCTFDVDRNCLPDSSSWTCAWQKAFSSLAKREIYDKLTLKDKETANNFLTLEPGTHPITWKKITSARWLKSYEKHLCKKGHKITQIKVKQIWPARILTNSYPHPLYVSLYTFSIGLYDDRHSYSVYEVEITSVFVDPESGKEHVFLHYCDPQKYNLYLPEIRFDMKLSKVGENSQKDTTAKDEKELFSCAIVQCHRVVPEKADCPFTNKLFPNRLTSKSKEEIVKTYSDFHVSIIEKREKSYRFSAEFLFPSGYLAYPPEKLVEAVAEHPATTDFISQRDPVEVKRIKILSHNVKKLQEKDSFSFSCSLSAKLDVVYGIQEDKVEEVGGFKYCLVSALKKVKLKDVVYNIDTTRAISIRDATVLLIFCSKENPDVTKFYSLRHFEKYPEIVGFAKKGVLFSKAAVVELLGLEGATGIQTKKETIRYRSPIFVEEHSVDKNFQVSLVCPSESTKSGKKYVKMAETVQVKVQRFYLVGDQTRCFDLNVGFSGEDDAD